MSRETDSSSSGPQGRGPAYPSGSDPYGTGAGQPSERTANGADARSLDDEPKTETTLTTRIRINIPGSRPIPPVVMRKPVGEGDDEPGTERGEAAGDTVKERDGANGGPSGGPAYTPGNNGSVRPGGRKPERTTSDWFSPRKPPQPAPESEPTPGRTATPPDGVPTGGLSGGTPPGNGGLLDGPPPGPPMPPTPTGAPRHTPPPSGLSGGPASGEGTQETSLPRSLSGPPVSDEPAGSLQAPASGFDPFGRPLGPGDAQTPPGARQEAVRPGGEPVPRDSLVSGIPGASPDGPRSADAPESPGGDSASADREDGGRKGKGRSRLVLAGVTLVGVVAIAYGAGLLLDHSEVPKGTTVSGVEIGGQSAQDAQNALDKALSGRSTDPMTLVVDGERQEVKPEIVGLSIDTEETVRQAAGRDYNPVSVIGSLFGGSRVVEAHVKVDEEKLRSAVAELAPENAPGQSKNGMVVFTGGKARAVPGEAHKAVDVDRAVTLVEDTYRARAVTGKDEPVELPVTEQQPAFGKKELQAAVQDFGKTAMSGWIWVKAGDVELPFSEQTIGTFLTMQGKDSLQPVYDLKKLEEAYGSSFDGVVIEGGAGTVPVQPKHVAAAMTEALRQPAPQPPEKRVAEVTAARSR